MNRALPYITALAIVLVTGLVHGLWSQRWSDGSDLERAVDRLRNVPLQIGDWQGVDLDLDKAKLERAEVAGYLWRRYTRSDGQIVNVVVLCGRFGPLSVHTPDVCYGGIGFVKMEAPSRHAMALASGPPAELWTARFEKQGPAPEFVRVFWSWSAGNGWLAPDYPRYTFRTAPVLYKLYVVHELTRADQPFDGDAGVALLERLIPELSVALAGS